MPKDIPVSKRRSTKKSASAQGRRTAARRSKPSPAKTFGVVFLLLLLGGLAAGGGYLFHLYRTSTSLKKYIASFLRHPNSKPADAFPNQQAINLLVIGRDYDYSDKDQILKSHARSDLLMVGRIDFTRKTVSLLSIPRDTRADIPGFGIGKINAAHAHGGPALTADTVRANFGIPTDHYIALDFDGFEHAIDQLGGVDLAVDKKMDYDDNWGHLHIHLKPGMQHLNGQQAMGFVRFRHSDSDLVRVQRQQALLAAIKTKLMSPQTLAKIPAILDTIDRNVNSDLTTDQKVALAKFVHDIPHASIQMATLPSEETSGPFVLTDWPKARPMIHNMFGVPLADESGATTQAGGTRHRRRHHRIARVAAVQ